MSENILDQFTYKCEIGLRWRDIDQFGHVNNAVYLTLFEYARFHYCKDVCNWDWAKDQFIIANSFVEYLRPLHFPDKTYCYLRVSKLGNKSFEFSYVLTFEKNGIEKIATTGYTTQVMFDVKSNKTVEIPPHIRTAFLNYEKSIIQE